MTQRFLTIYKTRDAFVVNASDKYSFEKIDFSHDSMSYSWPKDEEKRELIAVVNIEDGAYHSFDTGMGKYNSRYGENVHFSYNVQTYSLSCKWLGGEHSIQIPLSKRQQWERDYPGPYEKIYYDTYSYENPCAELPYVYQLPFKERIPMGATLEMPASKKDFVMNFLKEKGVFDQPKL